MKDHFVTIEEFILSPKHGSQHIPEASPWDICRTDTSMGIAR